MSIIVANWKAQLTFDQTLAICHNNRQGFAELDQMKDTQVVVCPSFEVISSVKCLLQDRAIQVGAQNCSSFRQGAYTGQVTAASLAEIGCTYCIIGHYEARTYLKETDAEIAEKAARLFEAGIEPIVCIGETKQEYENKMTFCSLSRQLDPLLEKLNNQETVAIKQKTICIAYEPVWAIGTGKTAQSEQITEIFSWISDTYATSFQGHAVRFLYGGSVTAQTIDGIKDIRNIDGILVGSASLDFKNFKNIVSFYR